MARDGDFMSRPIILLSAATASVAAIWGWLGCTMSRTPALTFVGCLGLALASAVLLGWGARGDPTFGWMLLLLIWVAALANASLLFSLPLPYLYDGVASTGGLLSSTSSFRRWAGRAAALADAALLPAVPGGATAAMGAVLAVRAVAALYGAAASTRWCGARAAARAARTAGDPALRGRAAEAARRAGLLGHDGRIGAADVFEFDPAGPHAGWRWICQGGVALGRFEVRPFPEYAAVAQAGRAPPACPCQWA
jgi:hypothetical protein